MMTVFRWLRVAGPCLITIMILGTQPTASELSELPGVSSYGLDLVAYATVRRNDGSYRRMLIPPETLEAVDSGAPLPDGTRILMETYYSADRVGIVFHKRKVEGKWQYGSFAPGRADLTARPQASCLSCHARAAETDFTYTLPSLIAAAQGRGASDFSCDRGGRSPCALRVYREGTPR